MGKIIWSPSSIEDPDDIEAYISKDSLVYAIRMITRILDRVEVLHKFPEIGRLVPEISDNTQTRELPEGNYRIVNEQTHEENIHIIRVLHMARDFYKSGLI